MNEQTEAPGLTFSNEIETAPIATFADYSSVTVGEDFSLLIHLARRFAGKRLVFFYATVQEGSVALMRHTLMRVFRFGQGSPRSSSARICCLIPLPSVFYRQGAPGTAWTY